MAKTLTEPTADTQLLDVYNRGMRVADRIPLEVDTKYAVTLMKLNAAVLPTDYPTLKAAIEAITGITEVSLIIDHQTRATVPADTEIVAIVEFNLRIESTETPV
jgi:hypothetical protein